MWNSRRLAGRAGMGKGGSRWWKTHGISLSKSLGPICSIVSLTKRGAAARRRLPDGLLVAALLRWNHFELHRRMRALLDGDFLAGRLVRLHEIRVLIRTLLDVFPGVDRILPRTQALHGEVAVLIGVGGLIEPVQLAMR